MLRIFWSLQNEFWGTEWRCLYGAPIGAINILSFKPLNRKIYTFILWRPHFILFPLSSFWTSNPLSNIPTDWFLLFQTKPTYFLLIPWLLTELTGFHYLRSNGKNHVINNYVKGNENERLFTFLFFKFINLKFSIMP